MLVMRMNGLITKEQMPWFPNKFSQVMLEELEERQGQQWGECACYCRSLKGITADLLYDDKVLTFVVIPAHGFSLLIFFLQFTELAFLKIQIIVSVIVQYMFNSYGIPVKLWKWTVSTNALLGEGQPNLTYHSTVCMFFKLLQWCY